MSDENLIYLPLGGAGEVGMNMYLYGYGAKGSERYILVDVGIAFPDMETSPGVNLIFPDVTWLAERKDRLDGIFITHAHEDHIGGLGHLYEQLGAPIFARKFTAHIARMKMEEHGQDVDKITVVTSMPEQIAVGAFKVGFLPISHSIPESSALVIDTPCGRIIHSGDFKLDETPGVGDPFNREDWSSLGLVKALICDSTNVFNRLSGRSEETVKSPIKKLIRNSQGLVVATTFASNIARVRTLAEAGISEGRSVVVLGRAMHKMISAGQETGVLKDFPSTISAEEALDVPRQNLLLIVTGSQGERRAASAQLSNGKFKGFSLKEGDVFLFSSKTIPGNEVSVIRIINNLSEIGVDVIDDSMGDYHVSGHANRPDLEEMHKIVKPDFIIPMHGEHRMLREHCKLATENNIDSILVTNGMVISISNNGLQVVDHVETGRVYQDGIIQVGAHDGVVRNRIKMALNGHVTVGVLIDENDEPMEDVWCELRGLPERGISLNDLSNVIEEDIEKTLPFLDQKLITEDKKLEEQLTRLVKRVCSNEIGKKPEVTILISRLA